MSGAMHSSTIEASGALDRLEARIAARVSPLAADVVDHLVGIAEGLVARDIRFTISVPATPAADRKAAHQKTAHQKTAHRTEGDTR